MSAAVQAPVAKSSNRRAPAPPIALTATTEAPHSRELLKLEPAFDLVGQLFFIKLYGSTRPSAPASTERPRRRGANSWRR